MGLGLGVGVGVGVGVGMVMLPGSFLVVVNDFDIFSAVSSPTKTQTPLVVDAYAELTLAISLQCLKIVPRRDAKAGQFGGGMKLQQLTTCRPFDVFEPGYRAAAEQSARVRAGERSNHAEV